MYRSIFIAAMSALAATAAVAQSNVTIYGRLNETVEHTKTTSSVNVVNNNSSRIGFRGTEDLGGGLYAKFVLEHGFAPDTGASNAVFWGREATVGLGHEQFGFVRLGNLPNSEAYYATADYVSMHNHDTGTSEDKLYSGAGFTQTNKVGYFTPNISGFNAEFALHAGEGVDPRGYDVALNYDQGPLHLGAGYSKQGDANQWAIRGLYELGAFTFGGYAQREDDSRSLGKDKRWIGRAAVMYTMGQSEFHLNVGGTKAGGSSFNSGRNGGKQYTLAYNYNLSKRTKLYAFYTAVDATTANKADDLNSFALGIRHNF